MEEKINSLAPVVLFAYNRPLMLERTLTSLSENEMANQSILYIFCDGPKENATQNDIENIRKVRELARSKNWCKTVTVVAEEKNKGLARSIIDGVTEIVEQFDKIIVVEDDVLLSKYFLGFMNEALEKFRNNNKVLSVGAWNYFCDPEVLQSNFFFRFPDSIAWGTFKRSWNLFEQDSKIAYQKLSEKKLMPIFNAKLKWPYFENMLLEQIKGNINSWAIRWTATCIINDMLNYFPQQTLAVHIGFGSDATHENQSSDYNSRLILADKPQTIKNIDMVENETALNEWQKFVTTNFVPMRKKKQIWKNKLKAILKIHRK